MKEVGMEGRRVLLSIGAGVVGRWARESIWGERKGNAGSGWAGWVRLVLENRRERRRERRHARWTGMPPSRCDH